MQFTNQPFVQPQRITTLGIDLEHVLSLPDPMIEPHKIAVTQQIGRVHDQVL